MSIEHPARSTPHVHTRQPTAVHSSERQPTPPWGMAML